MIHDRIVDPLLGSELGIAVYDCVYYICIKKLISLPIKREGRQFKLHRGFNSKYYR